MAIRNLKDFYAGLVFILFGTAAIVLATYYQIGTAAKMGPGYFPFLLGGVLTIIGIVTSLKSISGREGTGGKLFFRARPVIFVLSSVVLFGMLLRPLGLLLSTITLVIVSSAASDEFRKKEAIFNAFVLLGIVLIIFVFFLRFQIPVWPLFLTGRT